jgi:hypothetical protein
MLSGLILTSLSAVLANLKNSEQQEQITELQTQVAEWDEYTRPKLDNMTQMMYEANRHLEAIAENQK